MSEIINNGDSRLEELYDFASSLTDGVYGRSVVEQYSYLTDTVTAEEAMQVIDLLLRRGYSTEEVKANVGKIINVFHNSLGSYKWDKPGKGHFLYYLMLENREAEKIMKEIRTCAKIIFSGKGDKGNSHYKRMLKSVKKLEEFNLHYIKKENILFPYLEKAFPHYRCLQIMWSFHDDFRRSLKSLEKILSAEIPDKGILNKELGRLFFVVFPIIFREEQIVFPVSLNVISEKDWNDMLSQSAEIGWCYNLTPEILNTGAATPIPAGLINLGTGMLSQDQIMELFNHLPVDITFVDENDEVRYFSHGSGRIFARSKAIIGRKVQNCHPPESVHIVNKIVEAFRSGKKDCAEFWIEMKGRFIHIRYFAMRDSSGQYKGTVEVSQDVTDIRKLKGEKRLLDWHE
jgi:uncharacterized protein